MGRQKKPAVGAAQEFARARAAIATAATPAKGLSRYKATTSTNEINRTLPLFAVHPAYKRLVWPNDAPKTFAEFNRVGLPGVSSFETELNWTVQCLLLRAEEIQVSLSFRRRFDSTILNSNFAKIESILVECQKSIGVSLWLAEAYINLYQYTVGYKEQKGYVESLLNITSLSPLIKYLASWISFRCEENVSASEFRRLLNEFAPLTDTIGPFVHCVLGVSPSLTVDAAADTLSYLDYLPAADRYRFLLQTLHLLISSQSLTGTMYQYIGTLLNQLRSAITDPLLDRLSVAYGQTVEMGLRSEIIPALDAYTEGHYDAAKAEGRKAFSENNLLEALHLVIRATLQVIDSFDTLSPPDTLLLSVENDLYEVLGTQQTAVAARLRLQKLILAFDASPWAATIGSILSRQAADERIFIPSTRQVYWALREEAHNPLIAFNLENTHSALNFIQHLERAHPNSHSIAAAKWLLSAPEDSPPIELPPWRNRKLQALAEIRAERYSSAASMLEEICSAECSRLVRVEASSLLAEVLLREGRLHEAAAVCSTLFVDSAYCVLFLPLKRLTASLITQAEDAIDPNPNILGQLPVVIVFDAYSRLIASDRDSERADSFNDFLFVEKVKRASELDFRSSHYARSSILYFFQTICVPEVLDQSLNLTSTRAVEDERAKLIVSATEIFLEAGNRPPPSLVDELREIRTRQVVRETAFRLDQSKVYVNIEGIRKVLALNVRENWNRYKLMQFQQGGSDQVEALQKVLQEVMGDHVALVSMNLPLTERNKLFARMILEVRDQFALNKEFGLNSNLSTNIRHGYVLRELRGPFVARNLVTNKTSDFGIYKLNEHWGEKFSEAPDEAALIQDYLRELSAAIDGEIERLNTEILRVRSEKAPKALFDFTISEAEVQLIKHKCDKVDNYEGFIDVVIDEMWNITHINLRYIQTELLDFTSNRLLASIDNAQEQISAVSSIDSSELISSLNLVRPDIRAAVGRVADWFRLPSDAEFQDYSVGVAYEVGLATVKSYFTQFKIVSSIGGDSDALMKGWTLPHFTRIFSILIENAALHSDIEAGILQIHCNVEVSGRDLIVVLKNSLGSSKDLSDLGQKVDALNLSFRSGKLPDRIENEGGSGYPKILNILKNDLRSDHILEVGISAEREFKLELIISAGKLSA